jgi:hypothetical protein
MKMVVPAVNYEGSGAIQYLRAEAAERRELHLVLAEWSPYVEHSNSVMLSRTITITVPLVIERDFEARQNLKAVATAIQSRSEKLTAADLAAAKTALERLESRRNQDVETWADRLSADLSVHRD